MIKGMHVNHRETLRLRTQGVHLFFVGWYLVFWICLGFRISIFGFFLELGIFRFPSLPGYNIYYMMMANPEFVTSRR
jgi:hypothetical protein